MPNVNHVSENQDTPITLDDMGTKIIDEINANFHFHHFKNKVLHMSWEIVYNEKISCAYSAPIGQRMNFFSNPDFPMYFPGWSGRLWVIFQKKPRGMTMDPLNRIHIHTDTGGYGNYGNPHFKAMTPSKQYPMSWVLRIFEDDWAAMKVNNHLISAFPKTHNFNYTLKDSDGNI